MSDTHLTTHIKVIGDDLSSIPIKHLEPVQTYELKSGLIHLLPKFHGLESEHSHKHLKEYHVVCSTMRPQGIPEDYIKMKAFSFSLDGLLMIDQNMIDAASGGTLMDKTPVAAHHLISNIVGNTQQFGVQGGVGTSKVVSEVNTFNNLRLENQLIGLMSLVRQLAVRQHQHVVQRVCGICPSMEHFTNMCPILQKDELENIEFVGALRGKHQFGRQPYPNRQFDNQQFQGNRNSRIQIKGSM
ncbi:hypothetical protein CR513_19508, partial [Mucuna pruriens]